MCEGKMKFKRGKDEATVLPVLEFPRLGDRQRSIYGVYPYLVVNAIGQLPAIPFNYVEIHGCSGEEGAEQKRPKGIITSLSRYVLLSLLLTRGCWGAMMTSTRQLMALEHMSCILVCGGRRIEEGRRRKKKRKERVERKDCQVNTDWVPSDEFGLRAIKACRSFALGYYNTI